LLQAFKEFHARGFREVGLGVDAASLTGATRLYESVGMRVTAQFDIYEKQLA
jgi:ribosomal protein S18 acetylase RimI-like enzyme